MTEGGILEKVLKARSLCKSYRSRQVVGEVSLTISSGEVVGLLGPNGAGKTTTFYMIVGLLDPDRGEVFLDGEDITPLPMYVRARRGISYLSQEPSVFRRLSVEDNLYAIAETLDLPHGESDQLVSELLEEFGIAALRDRPAYTLSGGERRRLEIARALVIRPDFILLDEPFAGIDPIAVLDIQRMVTRPPGAEYRCVDHRSQRSRNSSDYGSRLHHHGGKDLSIRHPGPPLRRSGRP